MDQIEDKALLLKQYLREMETSLQRKQTHLAGLRRACEQLKNSQTLRVQEREKVQHDIELAVRKEKDDIAKMLIRKRLALQSAEQRTATGLRRLEEEAQRLSQVVDQQQAQYERLKIKAAAYCQQAQQHAVEDSETIWNESAPMAMATEEEVALELMRCKETLIQGGAQ
jgi:phage shock protein A